MARVARDASLAGLPSMDEVWGWHKKLAKMGPRYTGSRGHVRFTDWLQEKFSAVPGFKPEPRHPTTGYLSTPVAREEIFAVDRSGRHGSLQTGKGQLLLPDSGKR